jgi:fatty-acyl-CoA synthase
MYLVRPMVDIGPQADGTAGWFHTPLPLTTRLIDACDRWGTTVVFAGARNEDHVSLAELVDEATVIAASLQIRGVGQRQHVAVFGLTSRTVVVAILGVWLAGGAIVVLPMPMRLRDLTVMAGQARQQADAAGAALVVAEDNFADLLNVAPGAAPVVSFSNLSSGSALKTASGFQEPAVDLDDLAVLQLTSGATGDPKIVQVTHRQIAENHRRIVASARLEVGNEVSVSWLPLYHDMGLIGFLALPLAGARKLVLASPETFMLSPGSWMQLIARHRATVTGGPSFAYALAARALRSSGDLDLSSLRVAFNGGEPVAVDATERFLEAGAARRLSPSALLPVYGMAEATLMVTCPPPRATPSWDLVDTATLRANDRASPAPSEQQGRRLAILGPPVDGISLRVVDHGGTTELGDRHVGEIELRGPSITAGYLGRGDLTAKAFRDGWFRTGDRGYLTDGELVVCGRWKDLLIVGGRNIEPEEIERAVERIDGIRPGNVAAFTLGEPGGPQKLVVVAEVKNRDAALPRKVGLIVRSSVGAWPDDVVLVPPSTLPKTSSGKLRRGACRASFLSGELLDAAQT